MADIGVEFLFRALILKLVWGTIFRHLKKSPTIIMSKNFIPNIIKNLIMLINYFIVTTINMYKANVWKIQLHIWKSVNKSEYTLICTEVCRVFTSDPLPSIFDESVFKRQKVTAASRMILLEHPKKGSFSKNHTHNIMILGKS